jgi:hypothetical protein
MSDPEALAKAIKVFSTLPTDSFVAHHLFQKNSKRGVVRAHVFPGAKSSSTPCLGFLSLLPLELQINLQHIQ